MAILIVGANSFVAKYFILECQRNKVAFASCHHDTVPVELGAYDWIVNFSLNPEMFRKTYSKSIDQDFLICQDVASCQSKTKYVIISSRVVYGTPNTLVPMSEMTECRNVGGTRKYGENKLISENNCREILGDDRLLIVRASNIFGLELGRHTFMGIAQTRLLEKSEIMLDISKETRRDFIPVSDFSSILLELILENECGVFNVGSGCAISLEELCDSIISGYGDGKLLELEDAKIRDQFVLSVEKLKGIIPCEATRATILDFCYDIGCQLRKVKNELQ